MRWAEMKTTNRLFPDWEDERDLCIEIDGWTEHRLVRLANSMDLSPEEAEYACLCIGLESLESTNILLRKAGVRR